jgi:hypothetical protein
MLPPQVQLDSRFEDWLVGTTIFCRLGVSSKVTMGVVNTFETCGVFDIIQLVIGLTLYNTS